MNQLTDDITRMHSSLTQTTVLRGAFQSDDSTKMKINSSTDAINCIRELMKWAVENKIKLNININKHYD